MEGRNTGLKLKTEEETGANELNERTTNVNQDTVIDYS